jgi:carboxypeptidase C (cathepsin A)
MALELPSIAASHLEMTAGYDAPLDPVRDAEAFARKEYLLELVQGLTVSEAVKSKISQLTGLDPEIVARHHGRVNKWLFRQEYRRDHDRGISVYDGSITIALPRPAGHSDIDPILDDAVSVLTPVMVQYTRDALGFRTDLAYELLNREVSGKWDYGAKPNRQGFAGSLAELQKARTLNPDLKLFIAHGYTDLATPYSVSEFLVSQLEPIDKARPIEFRVYRGGHMMYMRPASRRKLTEDAGAIYASPAHQ